MSKSKRGDGITGQPVVRVRPEDHEFLLTLQAFQYPDKALAEVFALAIGAALEQHRKLLDAAAELRKRYPDKSLAELRSMAMASGLESLLKSPK